MPVRPHLLAREDLEDIPFAQRVDAHLVRLDVDVGDAPAEERRRRLQREQPRDRLGRFALGGGLEVLAEEDEGDQHRARLEDLLVLAAL